MFSAQGVSCQTTDNFIRFTWEDTGSFQCFVDFDSIYGNAGTPFSCNSPLDFASVPVGSHTLVVTGQSGQGGQFNWFVIGGGSSDINSSLPQTLSTNGSGSENQTKETFSEFYLGAGKMEEGKLEYNNTNTQNASSRSEILEVPINYRVVNAVKFFVGETVRMINGVKLFEGDIILNGAESPDKPPLIFIQ